MSAANSAVAGSTIEPRIQEGLDFHLYCHCLYHWNLPTNPVDLEQREGRVHRYKGHAVRLNVSAGHARAVRGRGEPPQDLWAAMFAAARDQAVVGNDLVPYWICDGPKKVERRVPMLPYSREVGRLQSLKKSIAVYRLALTLDIELFTQLHYRQSIDSNESLSPLFRDVFLYHWKEESQHAILDGLEWVRHDATISVAERDSAVDDFIDLVNAVDGILVGQAASDARYFAETCGRKVTAGERRTIEATFLDAYRWTYIHSGAEHRRFCNVLSAMTSEAQGTRIHHALMALH